MIAHNVITSGQLPKHMGWTDEAYRDADNLLGKGAGAMHITGDLSGAEFGTLINASYNGAGYPKLADYLQTADPGSKFIVVGEKSYAVDSATAPNGAIGVRLSSRSSSSLFDSCRATLGGSYRFPFGTNVPSYLSDYCGRWYINSDAGNSYGTTTAFPSWMYPEDGNRFFPGTDASAMAGHTGGDTWVADAAIEMMTRDPGRGCSSRWVRSTRPRTCGERRRMRRPSWGRATPAILWPTVRPRRTFDAPPRTPTSSSARCWTPWRRSTPATAARPWSC